MSSPTPRRRPQAKSVWEDLTNDLTPEGAEKLKVGNILRFDYEGSPLELKIVRKTRRKDGTLHVYAKHVVTHDPDEVNITETVDGHAETMNMGEMF